MAQHKGIGSPFVTSCGCAFSPKRVAALLVTMGVVLLGVSRSPAETRKVKVDSRLVELVVEAKEGVLVDWEARQPIAQEFRSYRTADGRSVVVFYLAGDQAVFVSDLIDWDNRLRDKTTWIVEVGDAPPPGPDPGPGPAPQPDQFGLVALTKAAKVKIQPAGLSYLPQVVSNFESTASAIAAGAISKVEVARVQIQTANRNTLTPAGVSAWNAFLVDVGRAVDALEDSGKITTVKQYGQALSDIAQGLK